MSASLGGGMPIDGVEVPVVWTPQPGKPNDKPLPAGRPMSEFTGGGARLIDLLRSLKEECCTRGTEGGVLYAWHL